MFGLTSNNNYPRQSEEYANFRRNYCGTCKTIGKTYGNKERFFLNHDVVFLSELISIMDHNENNFIGFSVNRCFELPKTLDDLPDFLKYSAATNIFLAYYKICDNVVDANYKLNFWHLFKFSEKRNFQKARKVLENFGLNINKIDDCIKEQFLIEKEQKVFARTEENLEHYSKLTGIITGEVFKSSINTINRNDLGELFEQIGIKIGILVYLIDAVEDYEKDLKKNKFNPIFLINSRNNELPFQLKIEIFNNINSCVNAICDLVENLPILEAKKKAITVRLRGSVSTRLERSKTKNVTKRINVFPPLEERFKEALRHARKNASKSKSVLIGIKYPILLVFLVICFVLFPYFVYANNYQVEANCCKNIDDCCCGCGCGESCDCCIHKIDKHNEIQAKTDNCPCPTISAYWIVIPCGAAFCCGWIGDGCKCGGGNSGSSGSGSWVFVPNAPSGGCGGCDCRN